MKKLLLLMALVLSFGLASYAEPVVDKIPDPTAQGKYDNYVIIGSGTGINYNFNQVNKGYAKAGGDKCYYQITQSKRSFITNKESKGYIRNITLKVITGQIKIYANNEPYTEYGSTTPPGTEITKITTTGTASIDIKGDYTYFYIAANTSNTVQLNNISFSWEEATEDPAKVVSSVKINPESCEFEGEQAVTLTAYNAESSEIEGAEILYSLNDGEETTGTSPVTLTLTETTTVKAWAKNVGPVEATFTKKIPEVKPDKPVVTVNGEVKEGDFEIVEGTAITISSNNALSLKDNGTDEPYPNPYTFVPAVSEDIYEFVGINGKETSEPAMFAVTVKAPVRIARSATYDFTVDKAYGLDTQTGTSGTYETVIKSIPVGSASLSFADGAKYRHWAKNDGSYELRIIKNGGSFEISVSDDCYITSISFTGNIYISTSTANVSENNKSYKCTGTDVKTVVFNSSANDRNDIHTITVKYMKSIDPANQPVAPTLNHNVDAKTIEISHEDAECSYEYRYEVVDDTPAIQAYATETENWTPVKGNSIEIPAASHPITSGNEKLNFYVRAVKNDIHGEATPILGISNDGIPSGITDIEAEENGVVEYFNLQGVRVAEPANGLYLRRSGNKVEKVVIR